MEVSNRLRPLILVELNREDQVTDFISEVQESYKNLWAIESDSIGHLSIDDRVEYLYADFVTLLTAREQDLKVFEVYSYQIIVPTRFLILEAKEESSDSLASLLRREKRAFFSSLWELDYCSVFTASGLLKTSMYSSGFESLIERIAQGCLDFYSLEYEQPEEGT